MCFGKSSRTSYRESRVEKSVKSQWDNNAHQSHGGSRRRPPSRTSSWRVAAGPIPGAAREQLSEAHMLIHTLTHITTQATRTHTKKHTHSHTYTHARTHTHWLHAQFLCGAFEALEQRVVLGVNVRMTNARNRWPPSHTTQPHTNSTLSRNVYVLA